MLRSMSGCSQMFNLVGPAVSMIGCMTTLNWNHRSFTAPFTSGGTSALVQAPPWHYAGWLLNVAFVHDGPRSQDLVPPEAGRITGRGCVHFADWQACTNSEELTDPIYAQYRETIVVLELARPNGGRAMYCPAIWVDQDISLMRGLLQGWPKKLGSTWLTRCLPLAHPAAANMASGTLLGASLAVKDRRLIEARAEVMEEECEPIGFLAAPTLGAVGMPDLRRPTDIPRIRLVRPDIRDRVQPGWRRARAQLKLLPHPHEELDLLGRVEASTASVGWIGITVAGATDG